MQIMKHRITKFSCLLLALLMVCALLPATALAASLPVAPSDIELDVGDSYEAFAGKIPQFVVSCAYCGGDLYTATPDARSDYEDISISSSSAGVVTGLGYDFANTTITRDTNHTYEAVTLHLTAAKPGATTITVQYKIYFSIPSLGNGIYSCGDCGYPVRYYGYQGYQTITRRFNVTVNDSTPTAPSNDTVNSIVDGAVVTVNCTNSEVAHADSSYALLNGSFTVGDVQGDASNGYTVGVTVAPDAYVTAYNTDVASGHSLSPASQSGTITLAYNAAAKVWEVQSGKPVTFTVLRLPPSPNQKRSIATLRRPRKAPAAFPPRVPLPWLNMTIRPSAWLRSPAPSLWMCWWMA